MALRLSAHPHCRKHHRAMTPKPPSDTTPSDATPAGSERRLGRYSSSTRTVQLCNERMTRTQPTARLCEACVSLVLPRPLVLPRAAVAASTAAASESCAMVGIAI
eukprot:1657498-Prymnesium_polylepis.1